MDLWIFAFGLGVAGLVAGGVTLTILEVGRADKARHGNTAKLDSGREVASGVARP